MHKVTPARPHGGPTRRELCTTRACNFPRVEVRCVTGWVCTPRGFNEWLDPNETAATRPPERGPHSGQTRGPTSYLVCRPDGSSPANGHIARRSSRAGPSPGRRALPPEGGLGRNLLRHGQVAWGQRTTQPRRTKTTPSMARSPGPWHKVPRGSQPWCRKVGTVFGAPSLRFTGPERPGGASPGPRAHAQHRRTHLPRSGCGRPPGMRSAPWPRARHRGCRRR